MEKWKDVLGYECLYEVSNNGLVRTKEGKVTRTKKHGERVWKQRILKEKNKRGRDIRVDLWKDGKSKTFLVHRLVAFAFIPEIKGKNYINHIDGNPRNNNVENLEWCNHLENNRHAFKNNLIKTCIKTTIEKDGVKKHFHSMAEASVFLEKNKGFLSYKRKKYGDSFTLKDGTEIKIIK